jgi:hypothetical protein
MSKPIDKSKFYRNNGLASNGHWACPWVTANNLNLIPRAALKCTEPVFTWGDKTGIDIGNAPDLEKAVKQFHAERYVTFEPTGLLTTNTIGAYFRMVVAEKRLFQIDERYYQKFSPREVCPDTQRFKGAFADSFILGAQIMDYSLNRHLQADLDLLYSTI